jgi:DNA-binding response OmpR family regulator
MNENLAQLRDLISSSGFSKTEQTIFMRLAETFDGLVMRGELLVLLKAGSPHTIDSHIMSIRRKLKDSGAAVVVRTVKGSGFVLSTASNVKP